MVARAGPAVAAPDEAAVVEASVEDETRLDEPWRVILYDDDIHTFDELFATVTLAPAASVIDPAEVSVSD